MSFQVNAFVTSAITGSEIRFELRRKYDGFAFFNVNLNKIEQGTYSTDENKFVCLDLFKKIYGDMKPRFELK